MNKLIVIVSHVSIADGKDIAGPAHTLATYYKRKKYPFLFIRHSIVGSRITFITFYDGINEPNSSESIDSNESEIVKRFKEGIKTIQIVRKYVQNNNYIYIGVDPLNSLWGLLLRFLGRLDTYVVFSPDYSSWRYSNFLVNKVYFFIDRITTRNAQLVLAVSERILELRKKQGIPVEKMICIPNSPSLSYVNNFRKSKADPYTIVMIGLLPSESVLKNLIDAIQNLKNKFPKIVLTIIGVGPGHKQIIQLIKSFSLQKNIHLLEPMSHDDAFKIIAKNRIGIALYTDDVPFRYYCDSMKARDYLAMGLPVIISGDLGTAEEIAEHNAGLWIKPISKEIGESINLLFVNKKKYEQFKVNALKLAYIRDSQRAIDNLTKKMFHFE